MKATRYYNWLVLILILAMVSSASAVTSVITRHNSGAEFSKGKTDKTVVTSTGTIRLSPHTQEVDTGDWLSDVWSIHTMLTDADGALYLGTGPDAKVLRYAGGVISQVYPVEEASAEDANALDTSILNEHVFAMAQDVAGRLLIAVSGSCGRLVRLDKTAEVVFEDERVQYIFAMAQDADNNLYLGTGPEGLVYRLNAFCQNPEVIYDARDNNILSLIVRDGMVYAGCDQRGLVYKIDPQEKRATVLYDTDQDEVASLLMDADGNLYAAATSAAAAILQLKAKSNSMQNAPGRPENGNGSGNGQTAAAINTANGDDDEEEEEKKPAKQAPRPPSAKAAGHIYKINPDGFVTDVFAEIAVFYSLIDFDGKLWLGTGNQAQLYTVAPDTEEIAVFYEDTTSSQITSLLAIEDTVYMGLSNPARLVQMDKGFESEGFYHSDLIDAGQPARWGKLAIEAVIPDDGEVLMASRSGNVAEPNDPTFSDWSDDVVVTDATDLNCPLGRFCQYRLTLKSGDRLVTPEIREVAAASVVPNLAPRINAVKIQRSRDKNKPTVQEIAFSASDQNNDTLTFSLDFRRLGRSGWIQLEDKLDQPRFEWASQTVEDGRYEVRVTADDYKSNSAATALTGCRVSDPVVVDNSAPVIADSSITIDGHSVTLLLSVEDALTMVGKVQYTVDSNDEWIATLPDDSVYDTRSEQFTIVIDELAAGDHVVAVAVSDDLENTLYQTFEVTIQE